MLSPSMCSRVLLSAASLVCFQLCCLAQDTQARAEAMLQHARQLSDIRTAGAPAFRLKATFSFVDDDLETVQGTYTEIRVSGSQWHRETVVGDLREVDVAGSGKHWLIYPEAFPSLAARLPTLMTVVPPASSRFDFASIHEGVVGGVVAECAYTKTATDNLRSAFCFDKETGVLMEKAYPERRPRNLMNFSCQYDTFRIFGDYWFPREAVCFEDRHKTISATVVELSLEPQPDPALFAAPAGAIELAACSGKIAPPTLPLGVIAFPGREDRVVWVVVWLVVDDKGRPQNLRVLSPKKVESLEKVLDAVRRLRFEPGTCDGKAIATDLTLEIPFKP